MVIKETLELPAELALLDLAELPEELETKETAEPQAAPALPV
jgi:hypothetical protein